MFQVMCERTEEFSSFGKISELPCFFCLFLSLPFYLNKRKCTKTAKVKGNIMKYISCTQMTFDNE